MLIQERIFALKCTQRFSLLANPMHVNGISNASGLCLSDAFFVRTWQNKITDIHTLKKMTYPLYRSICIIVVTLSREREQKKELFSHFEPKRHVEHCIQFFFRVRNSYSKFLSSEHFQVQKIIMQGYSSPFIFFFSGNFFHAFHLYMLCTRWTQVYYRTCP